MCQHVGEVRKLHRVSLRKVLPGIWSLGFGKVVRWDSPCRWPLIYFIQSPAWVPHKVPAGALQAQSCSPGMMMADEDFDKNIAIVHWWWWLMIMSMHEQFGHAATVIRFGICNKNLEPVGGVSLAQLECHHTHCYICLIVIMLTIVALWDQYKIQRLNSFFHKRRSQSNGHWPWQSW